MIIAARYYLFTNASILASSGAGGAGGYPGGSAGGAGGYPGIYGTFALF